LRHNEDDHHGVDPQVRIPHAEVLHQREPDHRRRGGPQVPGQVDMLRGAGQHCAVYLDGEGHGAGENAGAVFLRGGPVEGVPRVVGGEVDGLVSSGLGQFVSIC
jgi:hypothetical protein